MTCHARVFTLLTQMKLMALNLEIQNTPSLMRNMMILYKIYKWSQGHPGKLDTLVFPQASSPYKILN